MSKFRLWCPAHRRNLSAKDVSENHAAWNHQHARVVKKDAFENLRIHSDCKNHTTTPTMKPTEMKFTKGFAAIFYRKLGATGQIISNNLLCTDKVYESDGNTKNNRWYNYEEQRIIFLTLDTILSDVKWMSFLANECEEWAEKSGCWVHVTYAQSVSNPKDRGSALLEATLHETKQLDRRIPVCVISRKMGPKDCWDWMEKWLPNWTTWKHLNNFPPRNEWILNATCTRRWNVGVQRFVFQRRF